MNDSVDRNPEKSSAAICSLGNLFLDYAFVSSPERLLHDTAELDRLRVVLLRLARRIRYSSNTTITASQMSTLWAVAKHGPIGISEIAELEHVQPPSASKIVANLERQGFVERTTNPTDRRNQLIAVAAAGTALIDEVRAAGRGWLVERLREVDPADVDLVMAALPVFEQMLGTYDSDRPELPRS